MTHDEKVQILTRQIEILKEQNERLHESGDITGGEQIRRNTETIAFLLANREPHQQGSAGEAQVDGIREIVREEIRAALAEYDRLQLYRAGMTMDMIAEQAGKPGGYRDILKGFRK